MKTKTAKLIIRTLLVTGIIFGAYYLLFLKPKHELPAALFEAEKTFYKLQYPLIENRSAFLELRRLNPESINFYSEKGEVIEKIRKTNGSGLKELESHPNIKKVSGTPSKSLKFINEDLTKAYSILLEKNKKTYREQEILLKKLSDINKVLANIYEYIPESDLGRLDLTKDQEKIMEHSASTALGLTKLKEDIEKEDIKGDKTKIIKSIDESISLLKEFEDSLKSTSSQSQMRYLAFRDKIYELKRNSFELELSVLRSEDSAKALTDQTNLILEYSFWLNKIRGFKA